MVGDDSGTPTAQESAMPTKMIAVVDGHTATVKLEANDSPVELVVEDDQDLACIQLTPSIAREIIDKLSDWVASTTGPRASITDEKLAAAFRDVYAHIGVKP
jgi:hypothetical protein